MGLDLLAASIISSHIKGGSANNVNQHVDAGLKGTLGGSTPTLSVEDVHWSGIDNAHSGNDMIDVIFPSEDGSCVLSSIEVMHL